MKELFNKTWAEDDQGVRIFLVEGTERALVIDTGMNGMDVKAMAALHTQLPLCLVNTHADRDHISRNDQFPEFYMHPSEASLYHHSEFVAEHGAGTFLPVFEGDVIDLGEREVEVIHLPGHTPGSITLLDRKSRCLFGGDPVQKDGNIFMFGQHRDMHAYIASLKRLYGRTDFDFIYPSHGEEKVSRDIIPVLWQGAEDILAGKIAGSEKEFFGNRIMVYDIGVSRFLCEP